MPLSFIPRKVEAQSIGGYASGLAPAIALLPQCKAIRDSAINGLFSGIGGLFSSDKNNPIDNSKADMSGLNMDEQEKIISGDEQQMFLDREAATAASKEYSVQVTDPEVIKRLEAQGKEITKINIATESLNENST